MNMHGVAQGITRRRRITQQRTGRILSSSALASGVALDLGVPLKGLTAAGRMAFNEVDGLAAPLNRTDIIVLSFHKSTFALYNLTASAFRDRSR